MEEKQQVIEEKQEIKSDTTAQITAEVVEKWLQTEEGKRFIQPKLDQYFTKGLQTWQEKNLNKIKEEERNAVKQELEKQIQELNSKLVETKKVSALEKELLASGLKKNYVDLVLKALPVDKVQVADDKIIGLNDLVKMAKEQYKDLFEVSKGKANDTIPQNAKAPATEDEEDPFIKAFMKGAKLK